ncbi:MAG: hypothetical protein E7646_04530 [Ruminococcaceae bacterium]|nr:hypothetical protein [Oscillospiraceae bacterium]
MNSSFFSYRIFDKKGKSITVSGKSELSGEKESFSYSYLSDAIKDFPEDGSVFKIALFKEIPSKIKELAKTEYKDHQEAYCILASKEENAIYLYSPTDRGLIYAAATLIRLSGSKELTDELFIYDHPDMDVRGYRVYTPGRENIPTFKAMIDKLLYYKYNSIIIEVGGAMEYKRHPEINEKWVEFCAEIGVSPEVADTIQRKTYPWRKDSIHFENGEGGYISQEEMKDIVDYCKKRGFDVIPEVPSLSHADYIVRAFPQLNERIADRYPDTYCPSNPLSYEILFDIIDEVLEVFRPKHLNIGHDEYYTAAKCPLCKGKSPVDLYVGDIIKINDYLKTKGVKALMWADKFFAGKDGQNGEPEKDVPDLIGCRGKVPTDITLLNWAWPGEDHSQEELLAKMGYKMTFGNFDAISRPKYREGVHLHNGGFVSNWGSPEEKYMQRNLQNFWLLNTAYVFWSKDYTNDQAPMLLEKVKTELYTSYKNSLGDSVIEICHTTDTDKKYIWFWCGIFIVDSDWHIGDHTVNYTDGTKANLPVIYGYNIRQSQASKEEGIKEKLEYKRLEPMGASYPFLEDGKLWYKAAYKNPYPNKTIESITPAEGVLIKEVQK